jgi:hypothetical protein
MLFLDMVCLTVALASSDAILLAHNGTRFDNRILRQALDANDVAMASNVVKLGDTMDLMKQVTEILNGFILGDKERRNTNNCPNHIEIEKQERVNRC